MGLSYFFPLPFGERARVRGLSKPGNRGDNNFVIIVIWAVRLFVYGIVQEVESRVVGYLKKFDICDCFVTFGVIWYFKPCIFNLRAEGRLSRNGS